MLLRALSIAALAALASLQAQSPLTTFFVGGNGGVDGGCLYFDLTVATPVHVTGLDLNFGNPAGTPGAVEVYFTPGTRVGQQTNAAAWTFANSGTCAAAGPGVPTAVSIQPGPLLPGSYGIAIRALGLRFAYTNGNGANQTFATAEMILQAGEASSVPFTGTLFSPRVPNLSIHYVLGTGGARADDECVGATPLGLAGGTFDNFVYTQSAPATPCTAGFFADRWFRFIAPQTRAYSFHTCNAAVGQIDTVLQVMGGTCGSLVDFGCNDDSCGLGSRVNVTLAALDAVYVRVGGWNGAAGPWRLSVDSLGAQFTASPTTGTAPLLVQFTDQSTASGAPVSSWAWDFDGDSIVDSTAQNPSFTYTAPGTYTVSLTVGNGATAHTVTRPGYITVATPLLAGFSSDRRSGLAPLVVQFTDTSTPSGPPITSWAWDFDGDTVVDSTVQNPSFTYTTPGTYTVSLTVGDGVSSNTSTQPNFITASAFLLQADFAPTSVPPGLAPVVVQFVDASTASGSPIVNWAWDTDGNGVDDRFGQGPHSVTYSTVGTYTVRLTVTNALGGVSTRRRPGLVRVDPPPGDECSSATVLSLGQYEFGPFSTQGCTPSPTAAVCGAAADRDRWFRFQGLNPFLHRITITNPSGPLHAELRTGTCGSQTAGTCALPNGNGNEVEILANLTGGQTCYLRVAGAGGSTVGFGIRIRPADDECIGAIPLQVGNNPTAYGFDYSMSPLPLCGGISDRWFSFTPPYAAIWTISTGSTNAIEVRDSCGGALLQPCAQSPVSLALQAQTSCLVRVGLGLGASMNPNIVVTGGLRIAPRDVVFNELVYSATATGRFLELCNRTAAPIDLAGWQIVRVSSSGSHTTVASVPTSPPLYIPATVGSGSAQQPGLFVFGSGAGAGAPLGSVPTGATSLRLLNAAGELVDTLAYRASDGAVPTPALQGEPLFGHHVHNSSSPNPMTRTSWSRNDDGYVTEGSQGPQSNNGLEWRIVAATRGTPNRLPDRRDSVFQDYENLVAGTAVPNWSGGNGPPIVAEDSSSPALRHYAYYPASGGGGALGGSGRSFAYQTLAADNFSFEAWVRFELPPLIQGQTCAWSIGVAGTTDSLYEQPDPGRRNGNPSADVNGDTGIAWTYVVHNPGSGPEGWLYLVDNEAGGRDQVVLWRRQITTFGWENLRLDVSPESVEARISGSFEDSVDVSHYGSYGGIYVGVRESVSVNFGLGLDGVTVGTAWGNRDSVGPGCDGNCPPRNAIPATLSRSFEPADRTYAILVEHVGDPFAAFDVRFYMGVFGEGGPASASVAIHDVTGSGADTSVGPRVHGPFSLERTQLGWWKAYIGTYQGTTEVPWTRASSVYLVLTLDRFVQPPIVEKLTDGSPLKDVPYREFVNSVWGSPKLAPWIVSWRCLNGSQQLLTDAALTTTDSPGIEFVLRGYEPSAFATGALFGLTPLALPLGAFGAPTCKAFVAPLFLLPGVMQSGSVSTANVPLPNPTALLGIDLHAQWGVLDAAIPNPANLFTSSRRTVTIH